MSTKKTKEAAVGIYMAPPHTSKYFYISLIYSEVLKKALDELAPIPPYPTNTHIWVKEGEVT